MTPEIQRCLVLSTGHLPEDTVADLSAHGSVPESQVSEGYIVYTKTVEDGFFLKLDTDALGYDEIFSALPEPLRAPIRYALALDCFMIEFDPDGPEMDDLVAYDW